MFSLILEKVAAIAFVIAIFAVYFTLYVRHLGTLEPSAKELYLKKGNPDRWSIFLCAALFFVIVLSRSKLLALAAAALLLASAVILDRRQSRHLKNLGFSRDWIGKLDRISMLGFLCVLIVLGCTIYG
jgi:cobalamin synthase